MKFVFWQNIISPHQGSFLRALPDLGHEVTVVAVEALDAERRVLGWNVPDLGEVEVIIAPDVARLRRLIEQNYSDNTLHVMAGSRWTQLGKVAERVCSDYGQRMAVMTEAPDPRGAAGIARWIKYTLERFRQGHRYDFVIAMGALGVRWFRCCGYPSKKLYPFAYATESPPDVCESEFSHRVTMLFAGRFIPLKGLDLLVEAFSRIDSNIAQLLLLGDGSEKQRLKELAQKSRIADSISWLPQCDISEVQHEMGRADVTVLPSRKDGWGAVVNESLMVGTPVICSDACGAAELIQRAWLGTVFRSGQVADLARALDLWIHRGPIKTRERERIREWSQCISGPTVARYFTSIVEHIYSGAERPIAPWRK